MARLSREALMAAVLSSCRRWIARGMVPTGVRLAGDIPGFSETTLVAYRRKLQERGLVDWSHLGRCLDSRGLPCRTEADQRVIRERTRLVRLGIDPDTGAPLPPAPLEPRRRPT